MNISLDFDDTYTKDPALWNKFIVEARASGHRVFVVTMRYGHGPEAEEVRNLLGDGKTDGIYFTGRRFKEEFMARESDIRIDVWIDDTPRFITG